MEDVGEPEREPMAQLLGWVVDHVVAEANFEGEPQLLLGDREDLAELSLEQALQIPGSWTWVPGKEDRVVAIAGPDPEMDGPWVWAVGSDDGPLASIEISPRLGDPGAGAEPEHLGNLKSRSGFLAIGNYNSVRWWGSRAAPSTPDHVAEFRIDPDVPGPLRDGYIFVAVVPVGSVCQVFGTRGHDHSRFASFTVRLSVPPWLPDPIPLREY